MIEEANNNMRKCVEFSKVSEDYQSRAEYWESRTSTINLSMPESLEFYEFELEKAKAEHEGLKNGSIPRAHSFSLTYAKKKFNDVEKNLKIAKQMWS